MKKNLKSEIVEKANLALKDQGLRLKHLSVDDYMKAMRLIKMASDFVDQQTNEINTLIKEYNKEYTDKISSEEYKKIAKKSAEEKELTTKEKEILDIKPSVSVLSGGRVVGPVDFIEKLNKIREPQLKDVELNFIKDSKIFKLVTENCLPENQLVLFDLLYKE